jgi:hypothetical protein
MFKRTLCGLIASTAIPLSAWAQGAAVDPLSASSRAEFNRILGSSVAPPLRSRGADPLINSQKLRVDTILRSAVRPAMQTIYDEIARLQDTATVETVASMARIALLEFAKPNAAAMTFFHYWHGIAMDVSAVDHSPQLPGASAYGAAPTLQQIGPPRTSRAMAMLHIALYEAANARGAAYESYAFSDSAAPYESAPRYPDAPAGVDAALYADIQIAAAMNQAGFGVVSSLYPALIRKTGCPSGSNAKSEIISLHAYYICALDTLRQSGWGAVSPVHAMQAIREGAAVGDAIARRVIALRTHDGSETPEREVGRDFPSAANRDDGSAPPLSQWTIDPVSKLRTALGSTWAGVQPFAYDFFERNDQSLQKYAAHVDAMKSAFVASPPGAGASGKLLAYDFVKTIGEEPSFANPKVADAYPNLHAIATFWAYDGTAGLCAPVKLYNEIVDWLVAAGGPWSNQFDRENVGALARLYAQVNLALADAAIAAWTAKYLYQVPRPVTVYRGVAARTANKPVWFPFGAQVSNTDNGQNITPPFPAYPSGHAAFGGALFGILRQYVRADADFKYRSAEFNGHNKDAKNFIRCENGSGNGSIPDLFCKARTLTLDCAERENADSRLFMGVHWLADADDGVEIGNMVAYGVYANALQPKAGMNKPSPAAFATAQTDKAKLVCGDFAGNLDGYTPESLVTAMGR